MSAKKKHFLQKITLFLCAGMVALVMAAFSLFLFLNQPVSGQEIAVNFTIPRGQAVRIVGQRLEEGGLFDQNGYSTLRFGGSG